MNDLLSRLIGRATGAPSRVEPVLPSRYEPVGTPDWLAPFEQAELNEPKPVAGREARVHQEMNARVPGESVQQADPERIVYEPGPRQNVSPVAEAPIVPPVPAASISMREDGIQLPHRRPATIVTEPEQRRSEPPTRVERAEVRAASAPSVPPSSAMVKAAREESRPHSIPHASTPPHITRFEAAAPVEVQVTIGHIEVRIAGAAAAAPQPRISRPTVSLENYLQRRNGGGR
jgi:hypothetical protein